jgi:hypothetical protein
MTTTFNYTAESFVRGLTSLKGFLDKAEAFAKEKKFEPDTLLLARLAPDMYPLVKQIQVTCDTAKGTVARLAGKQPPKHEDNEKTFGEIRDRITKTLDYVKTITDTDLKNCEDRRIDLPWAQGKWMASLGAITWSQQLAYPVATSVTNFFTASESPTFSS